MRGNVNGDQRVAGFTSRRWPALPLESDLLTAGEPGWDLHLDIFSGRQVYASLGALGCFRQADGQFGMQVLPAAGRAEILPLEQSSEAACAPARRAAEHAAQNVLEAAGTGTTTARPALEAVRAEVEALEVRTAGSETTTAAARLRPVAFVAAKARLALGVDLTVVEGFALLVVAGNFIGGVQLGKTRGGLRIVLVGVGMQLFGEPPVGAFNLSLACTLRYPQDLVGVAH